MSPALPTDSAGLKSLLALAVGASLRAGQAILEIYADDFSVDLKADQSPVTLADRRAHAVIAEALVPAGLPLLSEEGKPIPYGERAAWESFWLVDPLDGTKEFIKKNGEFTVNIALIRGGRPVLGVVLAPALDQLYFAAEGLGAWGGKGAQPRNAGWESLRDSVQPLNLKPFPAEGGTLRVVASRSHATPETENCLGELRKKYQVELLSSGSSLKFCLVASGRADLYPRFAPTMEWDTAAGQALVEQAGGAVWRCEDGMPLVYNKENLLNPWFQAGGRGSEGV